MNNCAFTICAKNYIGLAKILEKSIRKYSDDVDFFIIVADEFDFESKPTESNILIAREILLFKEEKWSELTFKYDLTEFCTCIKPFVFKYLFQTFKYKKICYFDPDILFFNSADAIYKELDTCEILITPHNLCFCNNENDNILEDEKRGTGIFNFGFLGLSFGQYSNNFLEWWSNRLLNKCFSDASKYLFTDQKWGDFLPAYFPSDVLHVSRHLGWNVAPWNFWERRILFIKENFYVTERNNETNKKEILLFVHFSGYDYLSLSNGNIQQKHLSHDVFFEDLNIVFDIYKEALTQEREILDKYLVERYSYGYYSNNEKIELFHRRLFHGLLINKIRIDNPFDSNNKLFYKKIKRKKMFTKNNDNIEKITKNNMNGVDKKLKVFNIIMRVFYNLLGYKNYILLLKLFRIYSRYENQIHLINSEENII